MLIVAGSLVALAAIAAIVRWVWLPQYRPGISTDEHFGVDVSNHQGKIDWPAVAGDDISFAYIKATEGADHVDASFNTNWDGARAAGLDVGAYHFFTLCRPGEAQAANFLGAIPPDETNLPAALDLELGGNCASRPSVEWVHREVATFIERVERSTGLDVLLYVGSDFDDRYSATDSFDQRLWTRRILRRPGGDRWRVWQFSYFSRVDGISGDVDLNVMRP